MLKLKDLGISIFNNLFSSVILSIFLMLIYAMSIGWATFVEKEYGTLVANDVIYKSWWFEILNVWILINILGCMYKSARYGFKISVHIFHLSLVVMIIGAGITRYYGFEGRMSLKDGETSSFIISYDSFLNVLVSNDVGDKGMQSDILPLESFKKGYNIALSPYVRYSSFNLNTKDAFDIPLHIKSTSIINYSMSSLIENAREENRDITQEELDNKKKENHYVAKFEVEYGGIKQDMIVSNRGEVAIARFGNRFITLSWGPKVIQLPFALKLKKFEVLRYPGSKMESSFASYVSVMDGDKEEYDYKIFMNNVLDYKGYRFFQSEYNVEQDSQGKEKRDKDGNLMYAGTILSVNNDPGKIPTYIGYTLLILGALWLLFDNDSRFKKLSAFLREQKTLSLLFVCAIFCAFQFNTPLYANTNQAEKKGDIQPLVSENITDNKAMTEQEKLQQNNILINKGSEKVKKKYEKNLIKYLAHNQTREEDEAMLEKELSDSSDEAIQSHLDGLKRIPKKVLENFSKIQVQTPDGRIIILDTYSDEVMRKITGDKKFRGIGHNQFILALMTMPQDMVKLRFIKIKNREILEILGIRQGSYASLEDLFKKDKLDDVYGFAFFQTQELLKKFEDAYKLYHFVNIALKKRDSDRNEFDKEILKLHEKMDFLLPFSVWSYMRIIPIVNSSSWSAIGNPNFLGNDIFARYFFMDFTLQAKMGIIFNEWGRFNETLDFFHSFQKLVGDELYLNSTRVKSELILNKFDVFPISQYFYLFFGMLLFFVALISILINKKIPSLFGKSLYLILLLVFIVHTIGLILRWYVGGHAPWSNAYESMLYIAWASALSGIVILRKSYFALCSASFLAGIALMVAHLGFMDPQIGNLQPVLKSYWLNIHVSVIVASYGFLGLSLMLGIINLILFIFRSPNRMQVDSSIYSLTAINEMSMIIGILMLIVGTFLGGVWANESWGRYWSWDSKETWSLVSVGIYACVLHVRLLHPLYLPYIFNVLSVVAFYSIIMTYFGVNYYLATGMHSYAQGQGGGVSNSLYFALFLTFLLIFISFFKRKLIAIKELY